MTRMAYVNGAILDAAEATISIFDRGFIFGDAIYEVTAMLEGRFVDIDGHLARLDRSLGAIGIRNPHDAPGWIAIHQRIAEANGLSNGLVYLQVTRGVAERDFMPPQDIEPTVVLFTQEKDILAGAGLRDGIRVISAPDIRWLRRDIKSTSLLAQVMAKAALRGTGAQEVWMHQDGLVTEGASSTAYLVDRQGRLRTRAFDGEVLPGITRLSVCAIASDLGIDIVEAPFSIAEAQDSAEAIMTSASSFVTPIVQIDGKPVGDGRPGPVTMRLQAEYIRRARTT